jgi:ribosome maturation protein SDO1
MPPISQPVGQVRITNVAIVRMKRNGKKFEIAAYKNKVVNWRSRVETDVNEVLQAQTVFHNVSRGVVASKESLLEAFGNAEHLACAIIILDKGELEVSEKERSLHFETLFKDIAATLSEKCINPSSRRPYPVSIIGKALHDAHFAVVPTKTAKAQLVKALQALKERGEITIERARMKVRLTVPMSETGDVDRLKGRLTSFFQSMSTDIEMDSAKTVDEAVVIEVVADPGFFRRIEEESKGIFPGSAVEVVSLSVVGEGKSSSLFSSTHEEEGDDEEKEVTYIPKELIEGGNSATGAGSSSLLPPLSSIPTSMLSEATAASSRGTGMLVRRVTQPGMRGISCNACSIDFISMDDLKLHHKLDWHRFNLKRKVKQLPPMPLLEFEGMNVKERDCFLNEDM